MRFCGQQQQDKSFGLDDDDNDDDNNDDNNNDDALNKGRRMMIFDEANYRSNGN